MKSTKILLLLLLVSFMFSGPGLEAAAKKAPREAYVFKKTLELPHTPVKNQSRTGTCWAFATVSFLESELLRQGRGEFDLSEMFIVRHTYPRKALSYIRNHGLANFSQGGQSHDVIDVIKAHGMVTEEMYNGMIVDLKRHNHGEMVAVLKAMLDAVLQKRGGRVSQLWPTALEALLDIYLGRVPQKVSYQDEEMTPVKFADQVLGLDWDAYIELTSYKHHPFYQQVRLEIPDNWSHSEAYYNLPLDEFQEVVDHALEKGFTLVWDGDVSERFYSGQKGYAVVPERDWDDLSRAEQEAVPTAPIPEKAVDQEMRESTLADFSTTDDHLMHIVGKASDQLGRPFYLIKNSGGTDRAYKGYMYMSVPYLRLKTVALMVHRDALPEQTARKLGLR